MTARNYDFILTLDNAAAFRTGNIVYGVSSGAEGTIVSADFSNNIIKVKMNNTYVPFNNAEQVISNSISVFSQNVSVYYSNTATTAVNGNNYTIDGQTNTYAIPESATGHLFKDSLIIQVNNNTYVSPNNYVYPSSTLGSRGVDFLIHEKTTSTTTTSSTSYMPYIDSSISNLHIQVTSGNIGSYRFMPAYMDSMVTTASANISNITISKYIAEKNSFQQSILVRLYTLYYPGEWYYPNANGNPTNEGAGYPWPYGFPLKFAEIRGDTISDLQYKVLFNGEEFSPYPINSSKIQLDSSGKVNDVKISISNFDNLISTLVENPFLVGNNISNGIQAIVNYESVTNIDPRTVNNHALYDAEIVAQRGGNNLAFDYDSTIALGGTWRKLKNDSRDLLGGVVEIKTTFANFLDYWPEFSTARTTMGNSIEVYCSSAYRPGDLITNNAETGTAQILAVKGDVLVTNNAEFVRTVTIADKIYIINEDADSESYVLDSFKINSLDSMDEKVAEFSLSSWLQYFKLQLPKRRFLKNTCSWKYKGEECQYPEDGTGTIPGSTKTANGFFNINNETVFTVAEDVCAKNAAACALRNNTKHQGLFSGSGRTIPR